MTLPSEGLAASYSVRFGASQSSLSAPVVAQPLDVLIVPPNTSIIQVTLLDANGVVLQTPTHFSYFLKFATTGVFNGSVTTGNITPAVASISASASNGSTTVKAGDVVTITVMVNESLTVSGAPSLRLNDGAVATYVSGSGTTNLVFAYAVGASDSTSDLQVTGLTLPAGAGIADVLGNSLSGPVAGDLNLVVSPKPAPTFPGVIFRGYDDVGNLQLWISDGTSAGTHVLASNWTRTSSPSLKTGVYFNGNYYFAGQDPNGLTGLWVTDGTAANTRELINNAAPGGFNPENFVVFGGKLYFIANDANGRGALWTSDGTTANTVELKTLGSANSVFAAFPPPAIYNGRFYFTAADSATGSQNLWSSDGTANGTIELVIANAAATGLAVLNMAVFNGKLYFIGKDRNNKYGLWVSDGTGGGTAEILGSVASPGVTSTTLDFSASELRVADGQLFLTAVNSQGLGSLLVTSNGSGFLELSSAGSDPLKGLSPSGLTSYAGKLYFIGLDASGKYGLWVTDGTNANTLELQIGNTASGGVLPSSLNVFNGKLYYDGADSNGKLALWSTDGSPQGTVKIATDGIVDPWSFGLSPNYISTINGKLYFEGRDFAGRLGLWTGDVSGAGTQITRELVVANAYPGLGNDTVPGGLAPQEIVAFNGQAYFSGLDTTGKRGLWMSDGTAANTVELAVGNSNATSAGLNPSWLTPAGSKLYFDGTDAAGKSNLWVSDGTAANTSEIVVSGVSAPDCGRRRSPRSTARSSSTASTPATVPTSGSATARRRTRRKS